MKICPKCLQQYQDDGLTVCPDDGVGLKLFRDQSEMLAGVVLDDRWVIGERIGAGGMGEVYRGRQVSVDREVAIKVLRLALASDETYVSRFFREANLASSINHPHFVTIHDFGQEQTNQILYLVMEILEGEPLGDAMSRAPLPLKQILMICSQICSALTAAHTQHVVHRDLKPDNVFLVDVPGRDDVFAKVLDFGIAKDLTETKQKVTRTGQIFGTPEYMSPEQCISSSDVDERSDLYSLGCILFELIAGYSPFHKDSAIQTLLAHVNTSPPTFETLNIPVPPRVQKICSKLLEKNANNRYQTAEATQAAFDKALRQLTHDSYVEFDENQTRLESASFKAFPTLGFANTEPNPLRLEDYLATDDRTAISSGAAERSLMEAQESTASMEMSVEMGPVEETVRKRRAPLLIFALLVVAGVTIAFAAIQMRNKTSNPTGGIDFAMSQTQTSRDLAVRSVSSDLAVESAQSYGRVLATTLQTLAPFFTDKSKGRRSGGSKGSKSNRTNPRKKTGPRTQKEIEADARAMSKHLMFCYAKRKNPDNAGTFGFKFRILPNGKTDSVSLVSSGFDDPAVKSCIVGSVSGWNFRPDPKGTTARHERRVTFGRRQN